MTTFLNEITRISEYAATDLSGTVDTDNATGTVSSTTIDVCQQEQTDTAEFGAIGCAAGSESEQAERKRVTEQEIKNAIQPILTKYGISNMADVEAIINSITDGLPKTQEELNSIVKCLTKILEFIDNYNKNNKDNPIPPLNAESIIYYTKSVKIMTDNKWSFEGAIKDKFTNKSQDSIADKLRAYYRDVFKEDYDFSDPANFEEIKKYAALYIKDNLNKNKKLGITDVAKMLTNCKTDEERQFFEGIIKEIADTDERLSFLKSLIYSFDSDEARTQTANNLYGDLEVLTGLDDNNRHVTNQLLISNLDNDGFQNGYEIRRQRVEEIERDYDIDAIRNKPENERTPEESEVLAEWTKLVINDNSDAQIGLANNKVMAESERDNNLILVDNTIRGYGDDVYRSVYKATMEYLEQHPEALDLPKDKFIELMNKVSNGNFDIIMNDKDGTAELNPSLEISNGSVSEKGSATDGSTGLFIVGDKPSEKNLAESKKKVFNPKETSKCTTVMNTRNKYRNIDLYLSSPNTTKEDIDNYIKEGGIIAIAEILNSRSNGKWRKYAYEQAFEEYKSMNDSDKKKIMIDTRKGSSCIALCNITRSFNLLSEVGNKMKTYYARQIVEKKLEKLQTC